MYQSCIYINYEALILHYNIVHPSIFSSSIKISFLVIKIYYNDQSLQLVHIHPSIHPSIASTIHPSTHSSVDSSISHRSSIDSILPSIDSSIQPSIYPSPSIYPAPSIHPSIHIHSSLRLPVTRWIRECHIRFLSFPFIICIHLSIVIIAIQIAITTEESKNKINFYCNLNKPVFI